MEDFNTGFTNKSYFHIIKSIVEGIYERNFDIRKFDFNFRDDSSINACADYDKQGNYDILKINTGTIIEIVALMKTAFAQRNILSNFGNANEEKNAIYTGEYVYRNNKHELIFSTQNTIVDPCREQLSFYVALIAIRFVFTHEVGHIVNGHTRENMLILYEKYKIDPTYLLTGEKNHTFDVDLFLANCSREERDKFIDRMLVFMRKIMISPQ